MWADPSNQSIKVDTNVLLEGVRDVGRMQVAEQASAPKTQRTKADGTPVSDIDIKSHNMLTEILKRAGNYAILSEEARDPQDNIKAINDPGPIWVMDPLDGTKRYLKGTPEFSIGIALLSAPNKNGQRQPVFGVNYIPASRRIYYTGEHNTALKATLKESGTGKAIFETPPIAIKAASVATGPNKKPALLRVGVGLTGKGEGFFDASADRTTHTRIAHYSMGVADGTFDAAICPHQSMIWDVAPLDAIVRAAGGVMMPVDSDKKVVTAHGFYYGRDAEKCHDHTLFTVGKYITVTADVAPHLNYAPGLPPPPQPTRKK